MCLLCTVCCVLFIIFFLFQRSSHILLPAFFAYYHYPFLPISILIFRLLPLHPLSFLLFLHSSPPHYLLPLCLLHPLCIPFVLFHLSFSAFFCSSSSSPPHYFLLLSFFMHVFILPFFSQSSAMHPPLKPLSSETLSLLSLFLLILSFIQLLRAVYFLCLTVFLLLSSSTSSYIPSPLFLFFFFISSFFPCLTFFFYLSAHSRSPQLHYSIHHSSLLHSSPSFIPSSSSFLKLSSLLIFYFSYFHIFSDPHALRFILLCLYSSPSTFYISFQLHVFFSHSPFHFFISSFPSPFTFSISHPSICFCSYFFHIFFVTPLGYNSAMIYGQV